MCPIVWCVRCVPRFSPTLMTLIKMEFSFKLWPGDVIWCQRAQFTIGSDNSVLPVRCQYWLVVNWTLGNKIQWHRNQNKIIFIQRNTFEKVVSKMLFILSQPQCVNWWGKTLHSFNNGLIQNEWQAIILPQSMISQFTNVRADSRFAPSQWETALHCKSVSLWQGTNLESVLDVSITRLQWVPPIQNQSHRSWHESHDSIINICIHMKQIAWNIDY